MQRPLTLIFVAWVLAASPEARAAGGASYVSFAPVPDAFALSAEGTPAPWFVSRDDYPGVVRVAQLLQEDVARVTGARPQLSTDAKPVGRTVVVAGTLGHSPLIDSLVASGKIDATSLAKKWEAFVLQIVDQPFPGVETALVITGSDKRGTIFGMFDLSAQIGVSPWSWWADVPAPKHADVFVLPGIHSRGEPKVKYRGIFINDEAPCLARWSQEQFGGCNHKFYQRVFELILRLKGNYLWPAMWGRSLYDDDAESARLADEYGVVIGTSHHEPMMRAHVEWSRYGKGPWDYQANESRLQDFWREGIRRMGVNESVVTIGMRGDGDKPMSDDANISLLEKIIADQRGIIHEVTGRAPEDVPQAWALYKEVQDYYDRGMRVPDDVTLLLCDDNWGNIRKLPRLGEQSRSGGYGVYYHFDYVGGPRNYKWLNTNPLPRIWEQMNLAYCYGVNRLWVVNVGDIKPMELPIEFFLDYAWDPDAIGVDELQGYAQVWAAEQFGSEHSAEIGKILMAYAKFNARRKPEMLSPAIYSLINYGEAERVVAEYNDLAEEARRVAKLLPAESQDAYFQLVQFPVEACANLNELYVAVGMNRLFARQGRAAANVMADRVADLFAHDEELCRKYNEEVAGGKWRHMMDQTHIGYTNWQEPPKNVAPKTERLELNKPAEMGVAIEGSTASLPSGDGAAMLPEFSLYDASSTRYLEVFNRGLDSFDYAIDCNAPWLKISEAQGSVDSQRRIEVSVDWGKAPDGVSTAELGVRGPNDQRVVVQAVANKPSADDRATIRGFVEASGYIAIEAEHFARSVDAGPIHFRRIHDLSRTSSAMAPKPVTAVQQTPGGDTPHLEYDIYLFHSGKVNVSAYVCPTLDFTAGKGRRYATSLDDAEPQIVDICADNSLQAWERNVGNNINFSKTTHVVAQPGRHVLKYWMVDAGVVVQRLLVESDDAPTSYLGPPESRLVMEKTN